MKSLQEKMHLGVYSLRHCKVLIVLLRAILECLWTNRYYYKVKLIWRSLFLFMGYLLDLAKRTLMGHLCCLEITEDKVGAFGVFQRRGQEQAWSDLSTGKWQCRRVCEKGGNGISLFTTPRDKRLSYTTHPASKYKESQTAVQTQHLNLTTKILSMSTIKLRMAAVPLNSFVL